MTGVLHHALRTSRYGEPFVGTCLLCGAKGLKPDDVLQECPNPFGKTATQSILMAIGPIEVECVHCREPARIPYSEGELKWRCVSCLRENPAPLPLTE